MAAQASAGATAMGLSCRGLRVAFNGTEALAGVDLHVAPGEWLGIIGPNGAGKSTLLRAIAGLVCFDGAVALACGRPPGATDVALVPQSPRLPEGMTVAEYVLLGRSAHLRWLALESRRDRDVVASVLQRLELHPFAGRPVTKLSGGETQLVVLARALAQQAPILLLDEPTSALDLGHRAAVLELLDELRLSDGLTVLSAMHDLSTAARFADRLALLHRGHIVADGPAGEVLVSARLSDVYATPLNVRTIDGDIVVLPAPRPHKEPRP